MTSEDRKERNRQYRRKWYKANKEKVNEKCKSWRKANPEKVKEYNVKHKQQRLEVSKLWASLNREKIREADRMRRLKKKALLKKEEINDGAH